MALKTSLTLIAKRIAKAVKEYATNEGFPRDDYALVGAYDEESGRISLTLGTTRKVDERRWYSGLMQEFRRAFPEHPQLTMHIGLVIRWVPNLDEIYWDTGMRENDFDMTELLDRFLSEVRP